MATPAEMAALERERIRQEAQSSRLRYQTTTLSFEDALDFITKRGQTAERRSATAMREVSDLEQLRAKLSTDGFFRAIGQIGPMAQRISSGAMSQKDQNDFIIELKKLQLASTKALSQTDDAALARWTTAGTAVAGPGADRATTGAEIYKVAIPELLKNGQYNPSLVGTVKALSAYAVPAEMADDWARVQAMAQDRTDQINDINAYASQIPDNISTVGPEAQAAAVSTFFQKVDPNELNQFAQKLGSLPNPALLDQAILDKKTEAQVAKRVVDEYLQMDPFSLADKFAGGAKTAKDSERLRILSSEKFQKWAASNGLRVGSVRPATEADKDLPGYIPSKNVVYVAGPEDDRALGIATKQATMKPSQMLIPRRGLETRKYVEATVGGTAQPGPTGFVKQAIGADGQRVFFRADGSAVKADGSSVEAEVAARLTDIKEIPADAQTKINETMASRVATTSGGQKIRGVETALMWSDPPDAVMAIETPEGKRVIIRKQDEKNINVLSGGKERKDGVVRSLLAKARERIARPGEDKLRAADEAAMAEVDKAREAGLETQRQAEQAAKPDRMQPAAAKAAVETAVEEAPVPRKEAPETMTTGDIGRAKALVGLGEKAGADIELQRLARRARGAEAYTTSDPNLYRSTMLQLGQEAEDFLRRKRLPPKEMVVGGDQLPSQPEVQVTPTTEAGKGVREASSVNMTGANAPQVPGLATGTPAAIPAFGEDVQKRKAEVEAARAERIRQAMLADRKKKQLEAEAVPMGASITPARISEEQRAGTTEADKQLQRAYTTSYKNWAAQQLE